MYTAKKTSWAGASLMLLVAPSSLMAQPFLEIGRTITVEGVSEIGTDGSSTRLSSRVRGVILSVSGDSLVLRIPDNGEQRVFLFDRQTTFAPSPLSADDLVGRPVRVLLNQGTPIAVGDRQYDHEIRALFGGMEGGSFWLTTRTAPPIALEAARIAEAAMLGQKVRNTRGAAVGGAAVGAAVGAVIALLPAGFRGDGSRAGIVVGSSAVFTALFVAVEVIKSPMQEDWVPLPLEAFRAGNR